MRLAVWISLGFWLVVSPVHAEPAGDDGVERLRIDGVAKRGSANGPRGPQVRIHSQVERLFIDEEGVPKAPTRDERKAPALAPISAPPLPPNFSDAEGVKKAVDQYLVYAVRRMARNDEEGRQLRERRRDLVDILALRSREELQKLDVLFQGRIERTLWGELKSEIPSVLRTERTRFEEHARKMFTRALSEYGANIRDLTTDSLLPPELILSMTLMDGSGPNPSFAREQFIENALFALDDPALTQAVRQLILTKNTFSYPWIEIVRQHNDRNRPQAPELAKNHDKEDENELVLVKPKEPSKKENPVNPPPAGEPGLNLAAGEAANGLLAPVDRSLIRRRGKEMAPPPPNSVISPSVPAVEEKLAAYVAAGTTKPDGEALAYRVRLPMRIPPPYRSNRTWRTPHESRIGKDSKGELPTLLMAYADYADLFDQNFGSPEKLTSAFRALNEKYAISGFQFPVPTLGVNGQAKLPEDYRPEVIKDIFNAVREYRYQHSSEQQAEPAPSGFRFEGWVGRLGTEFGYFAGSDDKGIRKILHFDPDYVELPITLGRDGSVSPYVAKLGDVFQMFIETEPDLWRKEVASDATYYPPYFRWNDEQTPSRWEMGLAFTDPDPKKATFIPLSAKFTEPHFHGGSWDRLSSLFSPYEAELERLVELRKIAEQVHGQFLSHLKENPPAPMGGFTVNAQGLVDLSKDLLAAGGTAEFRPVLPVWKGKLNELFARPAWHFGGIIVFDQGPSTAFALAPKGLAHRGGVKRLAFDANGNEVLSAGTDDFGLWRINTGRNVRLFLHPKIHEPAIANFAVATQSAWAVSVGQKGDGKVWDLSNGNLAWEFSLSSGDVREIAVIDEDKFIAVEFVDGHKVQVNVETHNVDEKDFQFPERKVGLTYDSSGAMGFTTPGGKTHRWKASDVGIREAHYLGSDSEFYFISRDEKERVRIWRVDDEGKVFYEENGLATCLAISRDHNFIVMGDRDGAIWVRRSPKPGSVEQPLE